MHGHLAEFKSLKGSQIILYNAKLLALCETPHPGTHVMIIDHWSERWNDSELHRVLCRR